MRRRALTAALACLALLLLTAAPASAVAINQPRAGFTAFNKAHATYPSIDLDQRVYGFGWGQPYGSVEKACAKVTLVEEVHTGPGGFFFHWKKVTGTHWRCNEHMPRGTTASPGAKVAFHCDSTERSTFAVRTDVSVTSSIATEVPRSDTAVAFRRQEIPCHVVI